MSVKIEPRSAWRAKPAKRFVAADPRSWKGVCVHWFGSPKASHDHAGCPALLRSVQRTHMAPGGLGVKDGGSDIGYNVAVCPHGVAYALRGLARRTGANGTSAANRDYCAVVVMIGEGDKLSGEAKNTLREVIAHVRSLGAGQEVVRHGTFTGSACPGPELSAWVNVKAYEPKPPPKKTQPPVVRPPGVLDPVVTTTTSVPFTYTTATGTNATYTIDVTAGNVKLTNQDPANPAVQFRLRSLFARFKDVAVVWKRKDSSQ